MNYTYAAAYYVTGVFYGVIRSDGAFIPINGAGWQDFLAWNNAQPVPITFGNIASSVRVKLSLWTIASSIFALTGSLPTPAAGTQKANIIANLFTGNVASGGQLWQQNNGPNQPSITAIYGGEMASNGLATLNAAQQLLMAALYTQDNPKYLVNPTFDPTINVPGDQPAS